MGALLSSETDRLDRLFFAIFPDRPAAERIAALTGHIHKARGLGGRPLTAERFHVSLSHLGDYDTLPRSILANAFVAGHSTVEIAPFTLTFDRLGSFQRGDRSRPLVLRCSDDAAIDTLHRKLGFAMKGTGLGNWVRADFTPHVTLLYDQQSLEEVPIEPISWTVRELVLVHSLLGQTTHNHLARWSLRG